MLYIKKIAFIIIIICLILLTGCNYQKVGGVAPGNLTFYLKTSEKKVIAGMLEPRVTIYASGQTEDYYQNLIFELADIPLHVDWQNVAHPDYAPKLFIADLNKDGTNELIVILTEQLNGNNSIQHIKIVDIESQREISVIQPLDILQDYNSLVGISIRFTIENNTILGIVSTEKGEYTITYTYSDEGYTSESVNYTENKS